MSASVVDQPRLIRIVPAAISGGTPIAASTWLGPTLPEEQAAPALIMTPSRSSAITWVSADAPGIASAVVLGSRVDIGADHDGIRHCFHRRCFEPVAQLPNPRVIGDPGHRGIGRRREPGDARQVLAAGAAAAFLAAAADHRDGLGVAGHHQRADPRRAAELVRREADEIGADLRRRERQLAGALHRVAMEEGAIAHARSRRFRATG